MSKQLETLGLLEKGDFAGLMNLRSNRTNPQHEKLIFSTKRFIEGRHPETGEMIPTKTWEYLMSSFMDGEASFAATIGMREAVGNDNFPLLFGTALDRILRERYKVAKAELRKICKVRPVRDFRQVAAYRVEGLTGPMQRKTGEGGYKADNVMPASEDTWKLDVYGKVVDVDWQTYWNDDLNVLDEIPARLADSAMNTENRLITEQIAEDGGPIAANFELAIGTAQLSMPALQSAIEQMISLKLDTTNGEIPITSTPRFLMIPPQLSLEAKKILNSPTVLYAATALSAVPLPMINVLNDVGIEPIVNPWLPIIDPTNGATAWYLFSDPNDLPFIELGLLRGQEEPQLFMRAPDTVRANGGSLSPMDGSFDFDKISYKVRQPLQATPIAPKGAYGSDGSA